MEIGQKEKPLANAKDFTTQVNYIITVPKRSKKANLILSNRQRIRSDDRFLLSTKAGNSLNHLEAAGLSEGWVALCRLILYPRARPPEYHIRAVRMSFKENKKKQ